MHFILRTTLAFGVCLGLAFSAAAQGGAPVASNTTAPSAAPKKVGSSVRAEERYHALSAHHQAGMAHAKALHQEAQSGTLNKEVAKEHAEEIGESIEAAKKHEAALEGMVADDAKAKAHLERMRGYHSKAAQHQAALQAELAKPNPDAKVVAEHAAGVHHDLKHSESEHQLLKREHKIKEAAEPKAPAATTK